VKKTLWNGEGIEDKDNVAKRRRKGFLLFEKSKLINSMKWLDSIILTCWFHKRLALLLSNYHDSR